MVKLSYGVLIPDPRHEGVDAMNTLPNIVLVHGAWADGSSWSGVVEQLQAGGYKVTAPQFPLTSLADDVARLRQVLALQDGPTVVAGHSYGGQVMTALGPDTSTVSALVYVAASHWTRGSRSVVCSHKAPFLLPSNTSLLTTEGSFGLPRRTSRTTLLRMSTQPDPR
jgi:pimeloyl-ACP methyl ester carboxylesterase